MKHNECGDGSQPILDFMVGVFQFHSPDQWHLEMSYPLECDWLSLIVLGQLKLSCSLALICCAAGFSPTRPQKGLKEQRNSAELTSCAWKLSETWLQASRTETFRHIDGSDANHPAATEQVLGSLKKGGALMFSLECSLGQPFLFAALFLWRSVSNRPREWGSDYWWWKTKALLCTESTEKKAERCGRTRHTLRHKGANAVQAHINHQN